MTDGDYKIKIGVDIPIEDVRKEIRIIVKEELQKEKAEKKLRATYLRERNLGDKVVRR